MPSKKIPQLSSRDGNRSSRQQKFGDTVGATAHLLNADPDRMQVRSLRFVSWGSSMAQGGYKLRLEQTGHNAGLHKTGCHDLHAT
jgi:hypothetical protein